MIRSKVQFVCAVFFLFVLPTNLYKQFFTEPDFCVSRLAEDMSDGVVVITTTIYNSFVANEKLMGNACIYGWFAYWAAGNIYGLGNGNDEEIIFVNAC